ncbi:MAG: signal peptide peptidase SppA [Acidobacteria bacterium]|nr:signal peptide peptidase SppA [Acidobacteriota bacterium]
MKKFLLGVLAGVLMAGLFGVVALLVIAKLGSQERSVEKDSTLVLRLEGAISEKAGPDMPAFLGGAAPPTVTDIWKTLKKAAIDPKIKAVVLMPRGLSVGWAKLQEIRGSLVEYKASGKPLFVFLRAPRTPEYYLATAADRIHMVPEDYLDMKGLRAEITYFKGAFDKLGVKMEAEHAGKYKDALDSFTRTNMTPESREALDLLLDGLYNHLSDTIGQARKKSGAEIRKMLDDGPFLADQAVSAGLIDALSFEDQFFDEVKQKTGGGELKKVGLGEYVKSTVDGFEGRNRIAMIIGDGAIVRGSSNSSPLEDENQMNVAQMTKLFRQVSEDKGIKGVILRVDSPGGDAVASDEILREAKLLSKQKPMVISMSDVAASGGYYISMTGDPVVAYPNTITGSIGVIYGKVNLKGLYDKLGLTKDVVQRGHNATLDSEYYTLDEKGRKKLRDGVDSVYKTFVGIVAESRKKKFEEIHEVAQGRVWLGKDAKDRALLDSMGGLDRAIELVKERAKLAKTDKIRLVVYPPKLSLIEQLLAKSSPGSVSLDSMVQREIREWTGGLPMELFREGAILRLMPYRFDVR